LIHLFPLNCFLPLDIFSYSTFFVALFSILCSLFICVLPFCVFILVPIIIPTLKSITYTGITNCLLVCVYHSDILFEMHVACCFPLHLLVKRLSLSLSLSSQNFRCSACLSLMAWTVCRDDFGVRWRRIIRFHVPLCLTF
jgi:hypothetical protein